MCPTRCVRVIPVRMTDHAVLRMGEATLGCVLRALGQAADRVNRLHEFHDVAPWRTSPPEDLSEWVRSWRCGRGLYTAPMPCAPRVRGPVPTSEEWLSWLRAAEDAQEVLRQVDLVRGLGEGATADLADALYESVEGGLHRLQFALASVEALVSDIESAVGTHGRAVLV